MSRSIVPAGEIVTGLKFQPIARSDRLEVILDIGADLGEGPIWDDQTGRLIFVDSTLGRIYRFDPHSGTFTSIDAHQMIGVAIPRSRDGLVASGRDGLLSISLDGRVELLVAIDRERDTRLNDAKCDSRGRLWSGTISMRSERRACSLYRIDQHLSVTRVQDGISVSNGIAWSPDEKRMYYVDTLSRGIDIFDYDLESGMASNRRRFVDIDRTDGVPDGITVDVEGHVWVALYLGGAVRRYSPDGKLIDRISLPVSAVTSCGFGGPQLDELYITTAKHGVAEQQLAREPLAGALFRYRPGVAGLPTNPFAG